MKKRVLVLVATVLCVSYGVAFAEVSCDLGVFSKYVGSTGSVVDSLPVIQGSCTKSFESGVYVNGWFSQSLKGPGLEKSFGNEIDATIGWDGKIAEKWSADLHASYYDLVTPRMLDGNSNGDMADIGGTLRYHINDSLNIYANVETYYGLGSDGSTNSWESGIGVQTTLFGINAGASINHNEEGEQSGEYLKLSVEPASWSVKIFGGELRPTMKVWVPVGNYRQTHEPQIVAGLRINW